MAAVEEMHFTVAAVAPSWCDSVGRAEMCRSGQWSATRLDHCFYLFI